jgi:hypothetical protein
VDSQSLLAVQVPHFFLSEEEKTMGNAARKEQRNLITAEIAHLRSLQNALEKSLQKCEEKARSIRIRAEAYNAETLLKISTLLAYYAYAHGVDAEAWEYKGQLDVAQVLPLFMEWLQAQRGSSLTAYDRECSLRFLESQEGMMQTKKQLRVFEQVSIEAHSVMLKTAADFEPLLRLSGSCELQTLVAALQGFTQELTSFNRPPNFTACLQKL